MDFFDFLLNPGVAVGCIVGIGAAFFLHWLFPAEDLAFAQALLIAFFAGVGMVVQLFAGEGSKRKRL